MAACSLASVAGVKGAPSNPIALLAICEAGLSTGTHPTIVTPFKNGRIAIVGEMTCVSLGRKIRPLSTPTIRRAQRPDSPRVEIFLEVCDDGAQFTSRFHGAKQRAAAKHTLHLPEIILVVRPQINDSVRRERLLRQLRKTLADQAVFQMLPLRPRIGKINVQRDG